MTIKPTTKIFNYIRGAIRSAYGIEDFRGKNILVVGVDKFGQELITKICFDKDVHVYFKVEEGKELTHYLNAFSICGLVEPWDGQDIDIVIDTLTRRLRIETSIVHFKDIEKDSYTQGLHDFYL